MVEIMIDNNTIEIFNAINKTWDEKLKKQIKGLIYIKEKCFETAPQISSAITAYGRIEIDKVKRLVIKEGGNIYYSDTDSIITDHKISDNMINSSIGGLKLENTIDKGWFISPKCYKIDIKNGQSVTRIKGVNIDNVTDKDLIERTFVNSVKHVKSTNIMFNNPIAKKFREMVIQAPGISGKTYNFKMSKRAKIVNAVGEWIDTEPYEYGK